MTRCSARLCVYYSMIYTTRWWILEENLNAAEALSCLAAALAEEAADHLFSDRRNLAAAECE